MSKHDIRVIYRRLATINVSLRVIGSSATVSIITIDHDVTSALMFSRIRENRQKEYLKTLKRALSRSKYRNYCLCYAGSCYHAIFEICNTWVVY